MLPMASRCTLASGGTTVVESNSSMTSGPRRGEDGKAERGTTSVSMAAAPRAKWMARERLVGAPARDLDRQLLEVEPALAQAAADHAQLHQLDRALVLVAVGLEVFGDEAGRHLAEVVAVVVHGQLGRLALVAQVRLPAERDARAREAVGRQPARHVGREAVASSASRSAVVSAVEADA